MKKVIKNLINFTLILTFIISSLIMLEALEVPSSSALGMSFNSSDISRSIDQTEIQDSLFFVDINECVVVNNNIYVYDNQDSTIKVVDNETNNFKATNNAYHFKNLKEMVAYEDLLLLLNQTNEFSCMFANDFSPVTFTEQEKLTTLNTAKSVKIISTNDKDYILLCPNNLTTEYFEIAELNFTTNNLSGTEVENVLLLDNVQKFKISETWTDLSTYQNIFVSNIQENLFITIFSNNNLYSFAIHPNNISSLPYQSLTSVTGLESSESIVDFKMINVNSLEENLAVIHSDKINFYKFNAIFGINLSINLEKSETEIDLTEFDVTNANINNSILAVVSNKNQALKVFDLTNRTSEGFNSETVCNEQISAYLYGNSSFKYVKTANQTNLLSSPYSKTPILSINPNDNFVIIGEGRYSDGTPVIGWHYVLYTTNNQNYYGFVNSIDVNNLPQTSYDKNFVTVLGHTKLYSFPSKFTDQMNTEIKTIQDSSRLEVLSSLCDYTSSNSSYLLVKVNGETIGFIDKSRVLNTSSVNDKIIPNATVTHNNSEIFTSTSDDKEIIIYLNKGDRVKVLGKRDTVTNFTKVTFNDSDGNEFVGYIYTHNLEPDSWSTMQIIGMILVLANIILLVIIISIKNKLTR